MEHDEDLDRSAASNRSTRLLAALSSIVLAACADIIGADFGSFGVRDPGEHDASPDAAVNTTTGGAGGRTTLGSGGATGSGGLAAGGSSSGGSPGSSGGSAAGSAGSGGSATAGSGGEPTMGGAAGTGGTEGVPQPPCCVDADCPEGIPFCSPWGTCYQGGDPYNCDYDIFCASFCVHCSGRVAGACEEKRCVCS